LISNKRIDEYAESMFRYERPHVRWIDACAAYLRDVFGGAIEGKVFLDYAFGRGNWSLAARKAGAGKVIAVDASASNVRRFSEFCREESVSGIEIVHGNAMLEPLSVRADILWIYGILHHIAEPVIFAKNIAGLRSDDNALALFYSYDRGSLREAVVESARSGFVYENAQEFFSDSFLYSPAARLRARDDLTAPVVQWHTAEGLGEILKKAGFAIRQQCRSFSEFGGAKQDGEFSPHHFLCGLGSGQPVSLREPDRPDAADFPILTALAEQVFAAADKDQKRKLAIGLCNTHFATLHANPAASACVIEDYTFLANAGFRLGVMDDRLPASLAPYADATRAAMEGRSRGLPDSVLEKSPLARFLDKNTVRF